MLGLASVRKFLVKYPLGVICLCAAVIVAYLVFVRETMLRAHPAYGAILSAVIAGLGFVVEKVVETYWHDLHEKISALVLRMWRWVFDDHFRFTFFVTTVHESPAPETQTVVEALGKLGSTFQVVLRGDNYVVARSQEAPLTFQISWQPEILNEEALEHGLEAEPRHGTELTVSLSQDLVLGYRTGRKILDSVVNKYFQIESQLERAFGARSTPNVFAEGTWFDCGCPGNVTKTFRDRTFAADVDIIGAGVHVRASSTDALKSLYSHIGSLPVC